VEGQNRDELAPADALAIWTIPPSPQEFHSALDRVNPKTVYLFGVTDPDETPETFMARLSGLLKYAVNRRAGKVSLSGLACATAQCRLTVQEGLEWLVSRAK